MNFLRSLLSNTGGRRFLLTVGNSIVCTWLLTQQYLSGEMYRDLIIATTAVYIAANTTQKFSKKVLGEDNDQSI